MTDPIQYTISDFHGQALANQYWAADPTYDAEILNQILAEKPLANAFVAPGANHILEVHGDEQAIYRGIFDAMLFVGKFLDRTFANVSNTPRN